MHLKAVGRAEVVEGIVTGDQDTGSLWNRRQQAPGLGVGFLDLQHVGGGILPIASGVLWIGVGELRGYPFDHHGPGRRAVPDMRIVQRVALVVGLRPVQQQVGRKLVSHRELPLAQRGQLIDHLRLQVQPVPQHHIGRLDRLDVLGGRLVRMRITARPHHGGDLGIGSDVGDRVRQVAGRGVDRQWPLRWTPGIGGRGATDEQASAHSKGDQNPNRGPMNHQAPHPLNQAGLLIVRLA